MIKRERNPVGLRDYGLVRRRMSGIPSTPVANGIAEANVAAAPVPADSTPAAPFSLFGLTGWELYLALAAAAYGGWYFLKKRS